MTQSWNDNDYKARRLLMAVEEETRRMGGKHLLTSEEYLDVINRCYHEIYGNAPASDADVAASGN